MKIVCISDTHTYHHKINVPDGDVVLHAGDFMSSGKRQNEIREFCRWFSSLPHKHKVFIAGNHDRFFEDYPGEARGIVANYPITYLQDESCEVEGLKIYGSPYSPEFLDWAFNLPLGEQLRKKWEEIPDDTDILITHGPPRGIMDFTLHGKIHTGCPDLLERVRAIRPKLHLFGHIHEGYGILERDGTTFVNASCCTLRYRPTNEPFVFNIPE